MRPVAHPDRHDAPRHLDQLVPVEAAETDDVVVARAGTSESVNQHRSGTPAVYFYNLLIKFGNLTCGRVPALVLIHNPPSLLQTNAVENIFSP